MNRRKFIRNVGLAGAAGITAPYILPSGRLYAASGVPMASHAVLVMFAGGVRNQESVEQNYLDQSQGVASEGNIMYNMMNGTPPPIKVVYGTDGSLPGDTPIPQILSQTLQSQGTLFKEVESFHAGHYGGMNSLIQGNTLYSQGLRQKPLNPTIFEYVRKHMNAPASKVWFMGSTIGNSTPLMNYSTHPDYGSAYGANFLAPDITFGSQGMEHLSDAKVYHPEEELDPIYKMKYFLDNNFANIGGTLDSVRNTEEEKQDIKEFFNYLYDQGNNISSPPLNDSQDLGMIGYACEVLKWFKPTLLVLNMDDVDACHADYTGYLKALHRADHAVGHIWDFIQTQVPEMAGDTSMLVTPECGRNIDSNPIRDSNDWFAFDHSDANSRRVFSQFVGPGVPSNLALGGPGNFVAETTDSALTIAEVLGIKSEVAAAGLVSGTSRSLFDRI